MSIRRGQRSAGMFSLLISAGFRFPGICFMRAGFREASCGGVLRHWGIFLRVSMQLLRMLSLMRVFMILIRMCLICMGRSMSGFCGFSGFRMRRMMLFPVR